jgi:hypothetical protein
MAIGHALSPVRRMQRKAYKLMSARGSGPHALKPKALRMYGAACHQMALRIRAHGLAHVVAVFAWDAKVASDEKQECRRSTAYIEDFLEVLDAGFALQLQVPAQPTTPSPAARRVQAWHTALCGTPAMLQGPYIAQARMALVAADVMKSMAELALGLDRDVVTEDEANEEATHA